MKKITANKGASETRHEILRKMAELERKTTKSDQLITRKSMGKYSYEALWEELRIYIKGMAPRASKKTGGVGRK